MLITYKRGPLSTWTLFKTQMVSKLLYLNTNQYLTITAIKPLRERFERLKAAAEAGNFHAAADVAHAYMAGMWDVRQMSYDLARGQLLPATPNPEDDPYLIVKSDQYLAVEYFKFCAKAPIEFAPLDVVHSRCLLEHIQERVDIQYTETRFSGNDYTRYWDSIIESASEAAKARNPLMPYEFKRPVVANPKTKMFINVAADAKSRSIYISYFFLAIVAFLSLSLWMGGDGFAATIKLNIFGFLVFTLPLLIFSYICQVYGIDKSLPICSCSKMREAYKEAMDDLPEECKIGDQDPFETTPFIIRNSHTIKQVLFGLYLIGILVVTGLVQLKYLDYNTIEKFIDYKIMFHSYLFMIFFPLVVLFFDKKVFSCSSVDSDCAFQLE